jgi:hypothetical protein
VKYAGPGSQTVESNCRSSVKASESVSHWWNEALTAPSSKLASVGNDRLSRDGPAVFRRIVSGITHVVYGTCLCHGVPYIVLSLGDEIVKSLAKESAVYIHTLTHSADSQSWSLTTLMELCAIDRIIFSFESERAPACSESDSVSD